MNAKPTTSEELLVYNFMRSIDELSKFFFVKNYKLDNQFYGKAICENKISLYGLVPRGRFPDSAIALGIYLVLKECDPVEFCRSLYKACSFGVEYDMVERSNRLFNEMKQWAEKTDYLNYIPDFELGYFFPETGEFDLSWEYVRPNDGYFELIHPNHFYDEEYPFYMLSNPYSSKSITREQINLLSKICNLHVSCINGAIVDVEPLVYQGMVESQNLSGTNIVINLDDPIIRCVKEFKTHVAIHDVVREITRKNSIYLNYLIKKHLFKYSIKFCKECISTYSNKIAMFEESNVFYIAENENTVVFIYENQNADRCSYVFAAKLDMLDLAVDSITAYMASANCNKRETIASHRNVFVDYGVIYQSRIYHDNFYSWKYEIDRIVQRMKCGKLF